MFQTIKNILQRPYPESESLLEELKGLLIASFIVTFILYAFKPFGLSYYEGSIFYMCLGFGLVTLIVGIFISGASILLRRHIFNSFTYNLAYWLIEIIIFIMAIAIGNLIFLQLIIGDAISLKGFGLMILNTFLVGIFPLVFFGMQRQIRAEKKNESSASELNNDLSNADEKKKADVILAVQSMQNYIIIYRISNGVFTKETERFTLKSALDKFKEFSLIKCHRSYLVNLNMVQSISGNAQGLKLKLESVDCPEIPVSRSFVTEIKTKLKAS